MMVELTRDECRALIEYCACIWKIDIPPKVYQEYLRALEKLERGAAEPGVNYGR